MVTAATLSHDPGPRRKPETPSTVKPMPTPTDLEADLHALIPLSAAMGVSVVRVDADGITLTAPLPPNHNHAGTAFGGSLYSLAAMAGWAWLRARFAAEDLTPTILIAEGRMQYRRPVTGALDVEISPPADVIADAVDRVRRGRSARMNVLAHLPCAADAAATLEGLYVALPAPVGVEKSARVP